MFSKHREKHDLAFEESLGDDLSRDLEVVEVPLGNRSLVFLGAAIFLLGLIFAGRIFYLNVFMGELYRERAEANLGQYQKIQAPRGIIYDRGGKVLVENRVTFTATLDVKELLSHQDSLEQALAAIENTLYIPKDSVLEMIRENLAQDFTAPIILKEDLSQSELVRLKGLNLPAVDVRSDFERKYAGGPIFASLLGYVGRTNLEDLKDDKSLSMEDFVGKAGIEAFYNKDLSGASGQVLILRNARGKILSEEKKSDSKIGKAIHLTIDSGFQEYFYERLRAGLLSLGRRIGVGLAINPQNGEVLALVNLPSFDNNILSGSGNNDAKLAILNSEDKPLFNRVIGGFYSPGSTIKPLHGIAALKEGVVNPRREIFSPGYLDVPNPYNPDQPTRYLDWRYQGNMNLASAIAQSSNVYFYTVGGGAQTQVLRGSTPEDSGYLKGLGINKLHDWWEEFSLGKPTGIDLPGEAEGFLPTAKWKEDKTKKPWLLGDTYNVSIGQGDLLLAPLQLLNYIAAIANGGKIYQPTVNLDREHPKVLADLTGLKSEIAEVQKGMKLAVTSPLGTAYKLHDLGFSVAAKTGSAQVQNNAQENALFVGFAPAYAEASAGKPADKPQIAILVLIENSREGSLNAVPIAKDVLNWYYINRVKSAK